MRTHTLAHAHAHLLINKPYGNTDKPDNMKNEVKVSVKLTDKNEVIVKNDTGSEWKYKIKDREDMPNYMISSVITSLLCSSIIYIMEEKFKNKIQFTIKLDNI